MLLIFTENFMIFFPSSLGAIKVLHFTVRSEDSVFGFRIADKIFPANLVNFTEKSQKNKFVGLKLEEN